MNTLNLYKHISGKDIAIAPKHIIFISEKNVYKVKVSYYNIVNPKFPYPIGITETVEIKKEDMKNWKEYRYE